MKKEDIQLDDWQRILFGAAPAEFMLEVLIRSILIYLAITVVARFLGKRMNGQLTQTELAVMLMLGALIAPAMQLPDKGVLLCILGLVCVLAFQRGITLLGFKNSKVERITQGVETVFIKDGILQLEAMAAGRISKQQIYAVLRSKNIYNLKKVERLYLEGCGLFSIYTSDDDKPGLSVLPTLSDQQEQIDLVGVQEPAGDNIVACEHCGNTVSKEKANDICPVCLEKKWVEAVC